MRYAELFRCLKPSIGFRYLAKILSARLRSAIWRSSGRIDVLRKRDGPRSDRVGGHLRDGPIAAFRSVMLEHKTHGCDEAEFTSVKISRAMEIRSDGEQEMAPFLSSGRVKRNRGRGSVRASKTAKQGEVECIPL